MTGGIANAVAEVCRSVFRCAVVISEGCAKGASVASVPAAPLGPLDLPLRLGHFEELGEGDELALDEAAAGAGVLAGEDLVLDLGVGDERDGDELQDHA